MLFSTVTVPIYIPTNGVGGFLLFHALSSMYYLDDDHSDQCEVLPDCSFDFHFPNS